MEKSFFDLTTIDDKRPAYGFAEKLKIQHNFYHHTRMTGANWLDGFLRAKPWIDDLKTRRIIKQAGRLKARSIS
jgi:hypothetical protein